jgi:hypothetical protein
MPWFRVPPGSKEIYELFLGGHPPLKLRARWDEQEQFYQLLLLSGKEVIAHACCYRHVGFVDKSVNYEALLDWSDDAYQSVGLPEDRKKDLGELIAVLIAHKKEQDEKA